MFIILERRGFKGVTSLSVRGYKRYLGTKPINLSSLTGLTSLDISHGTLRLFCWRLPDHKARAPEQRHNNLTYLDASHATVRDVGRLARYMPHLRTLSLRGNTYVDPEGVGALAASVTGLTHLDLSLSGASSRTGREIGVRDEGARAVASLTAPTFLDLAANRVGPDGVRALSSLTNLKHLSLSGNPTGAGVARALGPLKALTFLDMNDTDLDAFAGCADWLASLSGLTHLNLSDTPAFRRYVKTAVGSLTGLTHLALETAGLGDEDLRDLEPLRALTHLTLSDNTSLSDEGLRWLAPLTGLTHLDLENVGIGNEGARALSSLTALTHLNLQNTLFDDDGGGVDEHGGVGDDGVRALAALTSLTHLDLHYNNNITNEGLRALACIPGLPEYPYPPLRCW